MPLRAGAGTTVLAALLALPASAGTASLPAPRRVQRAVTAIQQSVRGGAIDPARFAAADRLLAEDLGPGGFHGLSAAAKKAWNPVFVEIQRLYSDAARSASSSNPGRRAKDEEAARRLVLIRNGRAFQFLSSADRTDLARALALFRERGGLMLERFQEEAARAFSLASGEDLRVDEVQAGEGGAGLTPSAAGLKPWTPRRSLPDRIGSYARGLGRHEGVPSARSRAEALLVRWGLPLLGAAAAATTVHMGVFLLGIAVWLFARHGVSRLQAVARGGFPLYAAALSLLALASVLTLGPAAAAVAGTLSPAGFALVSVLGAIGAASALRALVLSLQEASPRLGLAAGPAAAGLILTAVLLGLAGGWAAYGAIAAGLALGALKALQRDR